MKYQLSSIYYSGHAHRFLVYKVFSRLKKSFVTIYAHINAVECYYHTNTKTFPVNIACILEFKWIHYLYEYMNGIPDKKARDALAWYKVFHKTLLTNGFYSHWYCRLCYMVQFFIINWTRIASHFMYLSLFVFWTCHTWPDTRI